MAPAPLPTDACIALVGNPNTGKSTLFSALVGLHQRTGNYPGVTVEKKTGRLEHGGRRYTVVDLPGLYSLAPRSRDEMVTVDVLLGRVPDLPAVDAIVAVVDASNLERNLYLLSQALELGLPVVVALNMLDVAEDHGIGIDVQRLERQLGLPVIPTRADRGLGVAALKEALARAVAAPVAPRTSPLPAAVEAEVDELQRTLAREGRPALPRPLVQRLLFDAVGYLAAVLLPGPQGEARGALAAARARLAEAGLATPGIETSARYAWVGRVVEGVLSQPERYRSTLSDRVDRLLTHRVAGTAIFLALMIVIFQSVFVGAEPLTGLIEAGFAWLGSALGGLLGPGALQSLLVDGIVGGVGGVLSFLPQILILFAFLAILEDCGYMARAAYLMDTLMARVGLSGKSFIPLLSSFACAIPGIMAARVIENERDRLTTILVAPLMTCSARLPVYALLIAAFVPDGSLLGLVDLRGLTLAALYLLGIVVAVIAAKVLKRTVLRGQTPPFLMELPSYKWPSPRTALHRVLDRAFSFVRFAGTLILAVSIVVWAALYYPRDPASVDPELGAERAALATGLETLDPEAPEREAAERRLAEVEAAIAGAHQRQSYLGRFGRFVEPVFRPLGWDWRIGSAVIASFPAREVVVATLGVIFNQGPVADDERENESRLRQALREATWEGTDRPLFTLPTALSLMVFYALCAQCAATLAVIRHETNSWRWPIFTFLYMTTLAWVAAMATYQIGTRWSL